MSSSESFFGYSPVSLLYSSVVSPGVAPGGLGGYGSPLEHASPPSEGETRLFRRFLAFIVP